MTPTELNKRLQILLEKVPVPALRKNDIRWLGRNLGTLPQTIERDQALIVVKLLLKAEAQHLTFIKDKDFLK